MRILQKLKKKNKVYIHVYIYIYNLRVEPTRYTTYILQ